MHVLANGVGTVDVLHRILVVIILKILELSELSFVNFVLFPKMVRSN
jgi:hypothetical protein